MSLNKAEWVLGFEIYTAQHDQIFIEISPPDFKSIKFSVASQRGLQAIEGKTVTFCRIVLASLSKD